VFVVVVFCTCPFANAQYAVGLAGDAAASAAVSSDDFLKLVSQPAQPNLPQQHAYPVKGFAPKSSAAQPEVAVANAAYTMAANRNANGGGMVLGNSAGQAASSVTPANFQSSSQAVEPQSTSVGSPAIGSGAVGSSVGPVAPIGSGVSTPAPSVANTISRYAPPIAASETPERWSRIRGLLTLEKELPDFLVGYEYISMRRTNDSGGGYSDGGILGKFDKEGSGRYTVARLLGLMDQLEFVFTGPFDWDREISRTGPISTTLPTGSVPSSGLGALAASDSQSQVHQTGLNSFELNRRWSSDGHSSILSGLRIISFRERLELDATKGATAGLFQMDVNNLLVGGQMGIHVARPLSQRLNFEYLANGGLFGNFANGSFRVEDAGNLLTEKADDRLRFAAMAQVGARLKYHLTAQCFLQTGVESWYIPWIGTIADQRLSDVLAVDRFSVRTGDDQLFYGWSGGISAKF
jgi:hypothetical protein